MSVEIALDTSNHAMGVVVNKKKTTRFCLCPSRDPTGTQHDPASEGLTVFIVMNARWRHRHAWTLDGNNVIDGNPYSSIIWR